MLRGGDGLDRGAGLLEARSAGHRRAHQERRDRCHGPLEALGDDPGHHVDPVDVQVDALDVEVRRDPVEPRLQGGRPVLLEGDWQLRRHQNFTCSHPRRWASLRGSLLRETMYGRVRYPTGAAKTCTRRVKGQIPNRAIALSTCSWKKIGAWLISSTEGCRVQNWRNQIETPSR